MKKEEDQPAKIEIFSFSQVERGVSRALVNAESNGIPIVQLISALAKITQHYAQQVVNETKQQAGNDKKLFLELLDKRAELEQIDPAGLRKMLGL